MSRRDDDLRVRPGRIRDGHSGAKRPKSFVGEVTRAAKKAGHIGQTFGRSKAGTGGSRFGRGRRAALSLSLPSTARRVVTKARVVRHHGTRFRSAPLPRHIAYLKREGVWELTGPGGRQIAVRVAEPKMRANNGDIILAAARAGQGIAYSPLFMAGDDIRAGRLVPVLPDWRDERASVFAVHAHTRFVPAKVRVFIDFLAEKFAGKPAWEP